MNSRSLLPVLALSLLVFAGCTGDEGPRGPAGPAGPSATTVTFTLTNTDFSLFTTGQWMCDRAVPAITSEILTSGAVLPYFQFPGWYWLQMPYIYGNIRVYYGFNPGTVRFVYEDVSPSPLLNAAGTYKVVIVSGEIAATKLAGVDTRDYRAVKEALDLED